MEFWSVIFFLTSFASLIVPIVLCYKIFKKGPKGSYINGCYIFSMINFAPAYGGGVTIMIDSYSTLMIVVWIFACLLGFGIAIANYFFIKKNAKISHDDYAFNHSSGLTGGYALLYFFMYGFLILKIEDDDDFLFVLAYRKHAWIYYFVELIYFSGLFLSTSTEFFILKYDLNKLILIPIVIAQSALYALNIAIIIEFKTIYIIIIVIISLIDIGSGLYIWKKFYSDEDTPIENENSKKFQLVAN